ncbi:MAG TPA: HAD family hydrolase [Polyangiaceae bacterium]|nr:HAD family hydrolase [Polyangiaceae bacterium]
MSLQPVDPSGPRSIEVIAFDFDGTLADTTAAILLTTQRTVASLDLPPFAPEALLGLIGIPLREALARLGVPAHYSDEAVERYRSYFPEAAPTIALFPQVAASVASLRAHGLRLGVVSSRSRSSLHDLVERLGLKSQFEVVLGEEDADEAKPSPALVHALAARIGVAAERMLVVGDTTYDIEMGRAAGALTCAVTYGNHDRARLDTARPHHCLDSLTDLWSWLETAGHVGATGES